METQLQGWTKGYRKPRNAKRRVPSTTFLPSYITEDEDHDSNQVRCSLKGKQDRSTKVGSVFKRPPVKVKNRRSVTHCASMVDNPDADEGSEGSREKYATLALDVYSEKNYELVEIGPLAVGCISQGRVMHLNFKAINKDKHDAAVKTYFCELIKTNENDVYLVSVRCLGPSSKLPEKANTFGCVYCSYNIHHPDESFNCFRNGREEHGATLYSQIKQLRDYIRKCEDSKSSPSFSHPGVEYFGTRFTDSVSLCATVALRLFNKTKRTNFEFVKPGSMGRSQSMFVGLVLHINFNAKNLDDPDAGEQTFFAEVIRNWNFLFAAFCDCLGPSHLLPEKAERHGCCYCGCSIHHPPGPGYVVGREYCSGISRWPQIF